MGRSPPRGAGPPVKGQVVSTMNKNVKSPPMNDGNVADGVRTVPTNPARRVPTSPNTPSRLGSPPTQAEMRRRQPKISEYSKKRQPDKTSAYGKRRSRQPEVINDGTGNVVIQPPEPSGQKQPDAELQRQFNKVGFEVVGHLGSGTYAEVWKIKNSGTGRLWAGKVIQVDKEKTTENYQFKFLPRELDILPRIQHKNIIKVYQIVQFQKINAYCVVMEWAPGGTLADLLRKDGPLGESRVRGLMTPIFKAVEYLHDKNYAHRDMKLENILLDRIGNPKITDFSYVIDVSRASAPGPKGSTLKGLSGTFCGTEPYLSPEILDQKPYNPFLADTWAIGICLFVLTNNTLPFKCGPNVTTDEVLMHQKAKDWSFRERIKLTEQFRSLINACLEPDPNKRASIKAIINHPWTKI